MYLAQNLKYLREQRGLKQQELADILGVKQSTVGNWEAGKREPEINMLVCIAEYFNVSLEKTKFVSKGYWRFSWGNT